MKTTLVMTLMRDSATKVHNMLVLMKKIDLLKDSHYRDDVYEAWRYVERNDKPIMEQIKQIEARKNGKK